MMHTWRCGETFCLLCEQIEKSSLLHLRQVFSGFAAHTHTNAKKIIANWIMAALGADSPTNQVVF